VIAVTAIDASGRVYRRANRGDYIAFAAPGVRVQSRYVPGLSGTSFAAPVVAAEIARRMSLNPAMDLPAVLVGLRQDARDLGAPGRDPIYGWGEVVRPQLVTRATR
jgi:subtilisin family serine protease